MLHMITLKTLTNDANGKPYVDTIDCEESRRGWTLTQANDQLIPQLHPHLKLQLPLVLTTSYDQDRVYANEPTI